MVGNHYKYPIMFQFWKWEIWWKILALNFGYVNSPLRQWMYSLLRQPQKFFLSQNSGIQEHSTVATKFCVEQWLRSSPNYSSSMLENLHWWPREACLETLLFWMFVWNSINEMMAFFNDIPNLQQQHIKILVTFLTEEDVWLIWSSREALILIFSFYISRPEFFTGVGL